jgi:hypothetical protein
MIMDVNGIPTDTIITMTNEMHRSFIAGDCNPTCHCCNKGICVGDKYKLAHVSSEIASKVYGVFKTTSDHEVMLCNKPTCTPDQMIINYNNQKEINNRVYRSGRGGCSIIDGKIVP